MRSRKPQPHRNGPLRAALYSRVSSEEQAADGTTSLDEQERKCRDYAERKGWEIVQVYREEGFTGTTDDRPEWNRLEAACRAGDIDVVVLARWNRLARRVLVGLRIIDKLESWGTDIAVVEHDLDTTSPMGKVVRVILLAFAEMERDSLVSQMATGQYGAARVGRWPSSAAGAPFGLRKEGTGRDAHLVKDEREAEVIRTAARLLVDERMDKAATCRTLNDLGMRPRQAARWYPDLLREVMSEPARMGKVVWGKPQRIVRRNGTPHGEPTLIEGVPAILSAERFELVQRALHRRSVANPLAAPRTYPLSVRMVSPCGEVYHGVHRNDVNLTQYKCRGTRWQPWDGWQSCGCPKLKAGDVEARVWAEVTALLSDEARLRELASAYLGLAGERADDQETELARLDREIATLQDRVSVSLDGYLRAGIDPEALADSMERLNDQLAALKRRRDDIARLAEDEQARSGCLDALGKLAATAAGRLAHADLAMQAEVLALLDVRVTVLDRTRTPALRIEGVICSEGIADPASASAGNPGPEHPRRGWGQATAR